MLFPNFKDWIKNMHVECESALAFGAKASKYSTPPEVKALMEYYVQYDMLKKTWWLVIATWVLAIITIISNLI